MDGAYEYYLSVNSKCSSDLVNELKNATLFVDEMHDFDPNLGYTAFSNDRVDGIDTVGAFSTTDVVGKTYTQDVFADYDLTLVNVFTTWCSPCVEEIPVLEKLRQEYGKTISRKNVLVFRSDKFLVSFLLSVFARNHSLHCWYLGQAVPLGGLSHFAP